MRWMGVPLLSAVLWSGCRGPLTVPMVERLDEEQQQSVDDSWVNMLTPPDRLDRTLLLDVVLANQFHQVGIDTLRLTSEKRVGDGLVVMEVRFDRDDPASDEFAITHVDRDGYEIRRERYTREDVDERVAFFLEPTVVSEDPNDIDAELRAELELRAAEREARVEEIRAATQPAVWP